MELKELNTKALDLLRDLIETPSFSKEEHAVADKLSAKLNGEHIPYQRVGNNIWAYNRAFDAAKKTILLNSHLDTVKPVAGYTKDPFHYQEIDGKIYGLGSNDAGGALVSLFATFLHFYERTDLNFNILFLASCEEEISGLNGVELALKSLDKPFFGIVGEPTSNEIAIAEKGLLVVDCLVKGQSGHAARNEGENAFYKALPDFGWIKEFEFEKKSDVLGPVKMTCTVVKCGTAHNVVPDECHYTLDIRTNEHYSHQEILEILRSNLIAEVTPRSTRLQSSGIAKNHVIHAIAEQLGIPTYGSPTLSDQSLMNFPTIKLGPGDSKRSHTADEYIYKNQIEEGIDLYLRLLETLNLVRLQDVKTKD